MSGETRLYTADISLFIVRLAHSASVGPTDPRRLARPSVAMRGGGSARHWMKRASFVALR